ncbi:DUF4336 domain-containing protein [Marinilactibacillus sp. XAAS-LB27]|uniref:DUF4336 domain-containing protein n=1 Tax=Marinilactibacillus sp. XAAS-LB27 TaxID=3114538 RepID=UPI002E16D47E|nr:DUF4336 domain-containing protein [Marinilactibacillus sp. XAAS-LB27]
MSIPVYEPLNTLKKVAEDIWIVDGEVIHMNVLSVGIPFSTRMTIIKLADQSLWCHSPIQPSADLFKEIDKIGNVRHLVSPNKIHYAFIEEWKIQYPEATAWSSPGVEKRAASQKIAIKFNRALKDDPPVEWRKEIDQLIFKGSHVIEEVVFFHKTSQTLILADLIENFEPEYTTNPFWRCVHKLAGISDPNGQTPIDMRLTFLGQKQQARECFQRMLSWHPDKIILAHGRWYEKNGTAELRRAFSWLTD